MKRQITAMSQALMLSVSVQLLAATVGVAQDDGGRGPEASAEVSEKDAAALRGRATGEGKQRAKNGGKGRPPKGAGNEEVSREEHEKLRRMLQQVWDDSAVVQSREEVRVASDNFRKVLHAKLDALDPNAAKLMEKITKLSRSRKGEDMAAANGLGGGPRPMRPEGLRAGFDYMARPPFYASLTEEQRKIYDAAYKTAMASGALDGVTEEMRETRKQDDMLRQKRTKQFVSARKLLFEAMEKADPRVREYFAHRENFQQKRDLERDGNGEAEGDVATGKE